MYKRVLFGFGRDWTVEVSLWIIQSLDPPEKNPYDTQISLCSSTHFRIFQNQLFTRARFELTALNFLLWIYLFDKPLSKGTRIDC